jgi:hypothetical protein
LKSPKYTGWVSRHAFLSGTVIALVLGLLFQLSPSYWQLAILAGFAAGLVVKGWWRGFAVGFVGILVSWVVYVAYAWGMFPTSRLISALGEIVGIPGLILVVLVMLIGSLFGGLGGAIAAALRGMIRTVR